MTKKEAEALFKELFLPQLDKTDKPRLRMTWNNFVDTLQKYNQITMKQAATWNQPQFIKGGK